MARLWTEQTTNQALIKQRGPRTCSWREVTLSSRLVPYFLPGTRRGLGSVGDIQGIERTGVHMGCQNRGGVLAWVRGLGKGLAFPWVLESESGSVIPSFATGGGFGGGLARVVLGSLSAGLL